MIIQIWHSRDSNFQDEFYTPIRESDFFSEHTWIFPHDWKEINSRESLKWVDLFIAEVSQSVIGLGIEIGLASAYEKSIVCVFKKESRTSNSLKYVTNNFIEYESAEDMIKKMHIFLKTL